MRASALFLLSMLGCGTKHQNVADGVVDIAQLAGSSPASARDIQALIDSRRRRVSECADPVRTLVRQRDPGFGRVGVVIRAVGARGRLLEIPSVSVAPQFPATFGECVVRALRGTAPTLASGDYSINVRVHLCIDPIQGPVAS